MTRFLKGVISGIVAAAIVAGSVCAIGYSSRNAQTGKWFSDKHLSWNKDSSNKSDDTSTVKSWGKAIDDRGNEMNAEVTYVMPRGIAFTSQIDESLIATSNLSAPEITVSASSSLPFVKPDLDWTIKYQSGASAADVVTVTPSNDMLTAKIKCLEPFGEQLILEVSEHNGESTATTTIDYVKRIADIPEVWFYKRTEPINQGDDCYVDIAPVMGKGSLTPDLSVDKLEVEYAYSPVVGSFYDLFVSKLTANLGISEKSNTWGNFDFSRGASYYETGESFEFYYSNFIDGYNTAPSGLSRPDGHAATLEDKQNAIKYAWNTAYKEWHEKVGTSIFNVSLTVSAKYNGGIANSYTFEGLSLNDFYGVPDSEVPTNALFIDTSIIL